MTQKTGNGSDGSAWNAPVLRGLTKVEFVRDAFSTQTLDGSPQQEIEGFEARILRKHLRKTVIDYTVGFRNSPEKDYIGLHRDSDERLGHTFSILKLLRSSGFGEDSTLIVPRPILYMPSLSFLLMEKANGELLREILETGEDPEPYIRGAARWLAKLHRSNVRLSRKGSRDDEIAASIRFTRAASSLLPRFKSQIQSISKQLTSAQKTLHHVKPRLIHGDYHSKNIIVSPELTTVIDFEEARMGDPAFDLGYFVAQTKMTHGLGPVIVQATRTFLREYQKDQPVLESDFAQRVNVFEAQTYFQRIYHTYYLLSMKPEHNQIAGWLNESETCLQKAGTRP